MQGPSEPPRCTPIPNILDHAEVHAATGSSYRTRDGKAHAHGATPPKVGVVKANGQAQNGEDHAGADLHRNTGA